MPSGIDDAVRSRSGGRMSRPARIAIVEAQLGNPVAIGIELVADVGKAVPLRRILRAQGHGIVAADIAEDAAPSVLKL